MHNLQERDWFVSALLEVRQCCSVRVRPAEHPFLPSGPQGQADAGFLVEFRIGLHPQPGERRLGCSGRAHPGSAGADAGLGVGRKILVSDGVIEHAYHARPGFQAENLFGPGGSIASVDIGRLVEGEIDGRTDPSQSLSLFGPDIGDEAFAVSWVGNTQGRDIDAAR